MPIWNGPAEREDSPLAADARFEGDGKNGAKLKVAAAMLGVGLDDLVKRDERRQARRTRMIVTASLALAVVMTALAGVAITSRNAAVAAQAEAEFQRGEAEGLVEFMLTDLRKRLDAVGRLDVLDAVGGRALKYYGAQDAKKLNPDALGRRARALLLVGEMQHMRGDLDGALAAYQNAARTTEEQLNRDPEKPQRLFDHSQSLFWVGYIALLKGNADVAESYFLQYQKYAAKLVAKEPRKPEWQKELAYAHQNLGTVRFEKGDWKSALADFDKTLAIFSAHARTNPADSQLSIEISDAMAWRADAMRFGGDISGAMAQRQAQAKLLNDLFEREPRNAGARFAYVTAMRELGIMANLSGNRQSSLRLLKEALSAISELRQTDPQNAEYKFREVETRYSLATVSLVNCQISDTTTQVDAALPMLRSIPDPDDGTRRQKEWIELDLQTVAYRMRALTSDTSTAAGAFRALIEQKSKNLAGLKSGRDDALILGRAEIALGESLALSGDRQGAAAAWKRASARLAQHPSHNDARVSEEVKRVNARTLAMGAAADVRNQASLRKAFFGCSI